MSSTTSSDCENCDCSQCTYSLENNHNDYGKLLLKSRHVPMYATMGHPLIYYAEIQPLNRRQTNDHPRKDNPFKKAFKWYTKERCNKTDIVPEKCGFANWLDNKYVEYLRESGQQTKGTPASNETGTPRNSTAESCPTCPGTTKKFGRFKSPWRKRRRSGNDSGDVPKKCPEGSCEFLLKPKELTRAASETCYHTPTSGGKSNSTVASSNMPCNTKCSGRSHSLSDVAREKSALKHCDTVPHAVQECQEQALTKLATTICACHQKQGRTKLPISKWVYPQEQGPSKEQDALNQPNTACKCPHEKVPLCKEQVVKVSSKEQNASNQRGPLYKSLQEKVAEVVKVLFKEQDALNQPGRPYKCLQEKFPEVEQVPKNVQYATNQEEPCCKSSQEKVPEVEQVLTKQQDKTNQAEQCCKSRQEKVPEVEQVLTKQQDATNQAEPCCKSLQENIPEVEQVLTKHQDATNQAESCCKSLQEKVPEVEQVLTKHQDATNQAEPCCKSLQEKVPEVEQVLTKQQVPTNELKPLQEKVPKVLSIAQDPTNQLGLCCKCNLEKVPKVVQVPSQSRAVEESSQCPEKKMVSVHEETQYESSPELPRSTLNLRPCCCKTCNMPNPPPPPPHMLCIPVKVQSNKIANPEMCFTIAPVQTDSPKKQRAKLLSVSCGSGEIIKPKVDTQSQHQHEPSANSKDKAPSQSDCHELNQVFGPIPIRRQSYSTVAVNEETGEYRIVKEVTVVNKFTHLVTCASNEAAQTSNHSIHFEKDASSYQYPLFFKIICADIEK